MPPTKQHSVDNDPLLLPFEAILFDHSGKCVLGGYCASLREAREWLKSWLRERPGYTATINGRMYFPRGLR